jgi:large subunit ribosomal protein L9|tara:strand:- start:450 stop:899 length:450 start_codon:yes stop_codon:yes gene_type:complete
MEVILKKDIENLGFLDDVVKVKAGYGRNYLIPNGLAVLATTSEKKILQENLKQKEQKNQKIIEELDSVKTKIESLELQIKSKVGEDQKLFGSVTTASIAAELKEKDIDVEKKYIMINGASIIKTTGSFSATIRLHRDLHASLSFEVVAG